MFLQPAVTTLHNVCIMQKHNEHPESWDGLHEDEKTKLAMLEGITSEEVKAMKNFAELPQDQLMLLCGEMLYQLEGNDELILFEHPDPHDLIMLLMHACHQVNNEKIKALLQFQDKLPDIVIAKLNSIINPN